MNPQHTNPTAIARKAHTDREWKIPYFQSLRERQNTTPRTMDAITATISMMEITGQYTVEINMEKDTKLCVNPSKESIHSHQIREAKEELAGSQANNR